MLVHIVMNVKGCAEKSKKLEAPQMTPEQIRRLHLEEQTWRHIREFRGDIEKILMDVPGPDKEVILRGLCSYVLMRMDSEDLKLEKP